MIVKKIKDCPMCSFWVSEDGKFLCKKNGKFRRMKIRLISNGYVKTQYITFINRYKHNINVKIDCKRAVWKAYNGEIPHKKKVVQIDSSDPYNVALDNLKLVDIDYLSWRKK